MSSRVVYMCVRLLSACLVRVCECVCECFFFINGVAVSFGVCVCVRVCVCTNACVCAYVCVLCVSDACV